MKRFLSVFILLAVLSVLCAGCSPTPGPTPLDPSEDGDTAQISEQQARAFYEDLFSTIPAELLIMTDAELDSCNSSGISSYWFIFMADVVASGALDDIDGRYISAAEKSELEHIFGSNGYYSVYSMDDLQATCDAVWGTGRLSVDQWPSSDWGYYTAAGYAFVQSGFGDNGDDTYTQISVITAQDNTATVSVYWLRYNWFDMNVYDMAKNNEIATNVELTYPASFDDLLEAAGISADQLGTLDMVFYMTDDGIRLWGTFLGGRASYPQ